MLRLMMNTLVADVQAQKVSSSLPARDLSEKRHDFSGTLKRRWTVCPLQLLPEPSHTAESNETVTATGLMDGKADRQAHCRLSESVLCR